MFIHSQENDDSGALPCRYTTALYWAATTMSTTGYGDIVPRTNFERSYALAVMLIGVVVSALVFGVLAQIISEAFNDLPSSAQHQNEVCPPVPSAAYWALSYMSVCCILG